MTENNMLHRNSNTERSTLPRKYGGRGIVNIMNLHNTQINELCKYFLHRKTTSDLLRTFCEADKYTPLNLCDDNVQMSETIRPTEHKISVWKAKSLHERHTHALEAPEVDKDGSHAWLRHGQLFPETEGFMVAIQDQVIKTENYENYILKNPQVSDDKCRKCHNASETIQHITSGCTIFSQKDYLHRSITRTIKSNVIKCVTSSTRNQL
jgi:hypothetical protein